MPIHGKVMDKPCSRCGGTQYYYDSANGHERKECINCHKINKCNASFFGQGGNDGEEEAEGSVICCDNSDEYDRW